MTTTMIKLRDGETLMLKNARIREPGKFDSPNWAFTTDDSDFFLSVVPSEVIYVKRFPKEIND